MVKWVFIGHNRGWRQGCHPVYLFVRALDRSCFWAIIGTYFVAFNTFPINMILQYRGVGRWKDYLYGERAYIILSLAAKSLLAWLVLFGAMQP
jgi:hypothetical protein